jgi:hypothetical protein
LSTPDISFTDGEVSDSPLKATDQQTDITWGMEKIYHQTDTQDNNSYTPTRAAVKKILLYQSFAFDNPCPGLRIAPRLQSGDDQKQSSGLEHHDVDISTEESGGASRIDYADAATEYTKIEYRSEPEDSTTSSEQQCTDFASIKEQDQIASEFIQEPMNASDDNSSNAYVVAASAGGGPGFGSGERSFLVKTNISPSIQVTELNYFYTQHLEQYTKRTSAGPRHAAHAPRLDNFA